MAVWDGTARTDAALSTPIRGCRRSASARSSCRRSSPQRPPPISAPSLSSADAYEAHRIALGVPRGGLDFIYGDAFPHEADMDQLDGVDFDKGCYVGQEVVSRMEHRGTARTRIVPVAADGAAPRRRRAGDGGRQAGRHDRLGGGRPRPRDAAARPRRRRAARPARRSIAGGVDAPRRASRTGRASHGPARRPPHDAPRSCIPTACTAAPGPRQDDPLYVAYHDHEWGVPEYDDRALYEKLMLDGFQAGLSWITILRKRDNFRHAFDDFEPEKIARYDARKKAALMQDAGIVRNRLKIEGAVLSARACLDIMEKGPGFSALLWDFLDGKPKVNRFRSTKQVPAETAAVAGDVEGACRRAASSSSARPSSMPSCRRSAWSTTIS